MRKQTIMWTALPNGIADATDGAGPRLRLSVFVSPRLHTDEGLPVPRLSQFPDFLDWPARVAAAQFEVQFNTAPPVAAQVIPPPADMPGTELWQAIFNANTPVTPYEFPDIGRRAIITFPLRNVLAHIKSAIQAQVLDSPTVPPRLDPRAPETQPGPAQPFRQLLQEIAPPRREVIRLAREMDAQVRSAQIPVAARPVAHAVAPGQVQMRAARPLSGVAQVQATATPAQMDFVQLQAFHRFPDIVEAIRPRPSPRPPIIAPALDFHQILATLGEYPLVMRALGIVVDLEVPLSAAPAGEAWVSVIPTWQPSVGTTTVSPKTRCSAAGGRFVSVAGPSADDLRDGMLRLDDDEGFEVGQIDVDGAAVKTLDLAAMMRRATAPADAAMPSLRSAGLWVARVNRAAEFAVRVLSRARLMQTNVLRHEALAATLAPGARLQVPADDEVRLYAEDLVRGYRVDVWSDINNRWLSLCERVGAYRFARPAQGIDRGYEITDEGWISLAATQPLTGEDDLYLHEALFHWDGWSLCAPRPGEAIAQEGVMPGADGEDGLDVHFTPRPGSLPRLRFGRQYRLRARAVDLAGNGLTLTEADDSGASDPVTYDRHEPISPPVVVPRRDLAASPGEAVDRLVIRSYNDTPARDAEPTPEVSERHLAPPANSQQIAETHGMFDADDDGVRGDAETYNMIVSRDGTLPEFDEGATLTLPYLPDPPARSVTVRLMADGREQRRLNIPFTGDWPNLESFRVEVVERTGAADEARFDEARRVLVIPLAKAEVTEVLLSCAVPPPQLEHLGVWRWVAQGVVEPAITDARLSRPQRAQLRRDLTSVARLRQIAPQVGLRTPALDRLAEIARDALAGLVWMVTPSRKLTLVHAVQQPLVTPNLATLRATRRIGDTYATLGGSSPVDGKSTQQIDVLARWDDPVDNITEPEPRVVQGEVRVFDVPVSEAATSVDLSQPLRVAQLPIPRQPTTRRVPTDVMPAPGALLTRMGRRHEFGDTRYRRVRYHAVATTRFREYFPFTPEQLEAGEVSIAREGPEVEVDILSSARPAAPKVLYVVPTYGWERAETPTGHTSTRRGGGLRVYLERPWYSSGDGELLGVVLPDTAARLMAATTTGRLATLITRWGKDPLWRTGDTAPSLAAPNFPRAVATEAGLTLDELPGVRVAVAGHAVGFDADRQLWYCDIELDPGQSYYPFVRLALARYQPHSVQTATDDCKLSRVMQAEFMQLVPDRTASVAYVAGNLRALNVSVAGPSRGISVQGENLFEVSVESAAAGATDDAAWLPALDKPVELPSQRIVERGVLRWGAQVELPADRGTRPFRLVFREYEQLPSDETVAVMGAGTIQAPARRLVYVDTIEV